jgi:hypothetical protein
MLMVYVGIAWATAFFFERNRRGRRPYWLYIKEEIKSCTGEPPKEGGKEEEKKHSTKRNKITRKRAKQT